jgi:hypothetical protein
MALITDKFIFVHIPKTGGTWIRRSLEALGIFGRENAEPYAYHEHDGIFRVPYELRYSRPAFAIVRHPVTRLASLWSWAMLTNFNDKIDSEPAAAGHWFAECLSQDYEEFVVKYLQIHPGLITQITLSMLGYYQKAPGLWRPSKFKVDFIGKFETLEADFIRFLKEIARLEIDEAKIKAVSPQRVGASGPLKDNAQIPNGLRHRLMEAERELCDEFDYS